MKYSNKLVTNVANLIMHSLFFSMYVLLNKDTAQIKTIIALTDKQALKKSRIILRGKLGEKWVLDKIVLVNLMRKKTINKWD